MSDPPARNLAGLLTRAGIAAWSALGLLLLVWALLWILARAQVLIAPLVIAVVLIYVLNPIVSHLQRVRVPRVVGAVLAFGVLVGGIVLVGYLVAPSISDQAQELASTFPEIYEETTREIEQVVGNVGFEVDIWSYEQLEEFFNDPENQDQFLSVLRERLGALTSGIFEAILVFFLAPVIAFYLLIDLPRIRDEAEGLMPQRHRAELLHVSRQLGTAVGGFLRGQVLVAIIVGVLTSLGFLLIGLPFWLIIGMTAGFLNIIPFLGPWVGGGLGVIVGLATADLGTAAWAAIVALAVQQIDNNFISPTVLRATVRLHPAVVILALLLGGAVGGVWGVVLAVPVTASVKIVAGHFWRTRVLGQSWEEASEALIEDTGAQETLITRLRRLNDDEELAERTAAASDVMVGSPHGEAGGDGEEESERSSAAP